MFSKLTKISSDSSASVSASTADSPASSSNAQVSANGDKTVNEVDNATSKSTDSPSVELNRSTTFSKLRNAFSKKHASKKRQSKKSSPSSHNHFTQRHPKSAAADSHTANFSATTTMSSASAQADPATSGSSSFERLLSLSTSRKQTISKLSRLQTLSPTSKHQAHPAQAGPLDTQQTLSEYLTSLEANSLPISQMAIQVVQRARARGVVD
ncbi:unnamed protein product [Ambrosiozyma monospora]|uniref:Unnamed protein product n=1 Tax=Ambrosiozyma monospora TaxID=43982 RepID=A0ACB5TZC3_AMBMO|nr:unnamed protein product [Ambrosiozyma monospora]